MALRRWTGLVIVALLMVATSVAVALIQPPTLPRYEPPKTEFSAERAWRHIEEIARAPRPVGTAEHDRVRTYLMAELTDLGLEVDTLSALAHVRWGGSVRSALTRNLVARLPGTGSTGALLVMSHYDSAPLAPAAGDAGIGVATVLETARALTVDEPLRNDVIFFITDAEEIGLLGARAFVAEHRWMDDVAFVLNFEARGMSGAAVMFETGPGSGPAVRALGRAGRRTVASSVIPEVYARMPNDTDFSVFKGLGIPGLNFAIAGSAQWYHTPGDRPENLSPASLQHMGDNGLAMTRHFGDADLLDVQGTDGIYFHVPGLGLLGYGPGWAIPLAVLLVVAFLAVTVLVVRRRRLRWWAMPVGLLAAAVALAVSLLLPHLLWSSLQGGHQELGGIVGRALYREWPYTLGMAALAIAAVSGIFGLLRRWGTLEGLTLGALIIPTVVAVVSAVVLPAASYLLLWPTLLTLGMVALLAGRTAGHRVAEDSLPGPATDRALARRREAWLLAGLGLGALGIVLLMVPVVYLVHIMLGVGAAPLLGLTTAILALHLLPLLDLLSRPNRWWLPATAVLAGVIFLVVGATTAVGTPDRPAPSNLVHVQDDLAGTALWASPSDHGDAFTARFLGDTADTVSLADFSWTLRTGRYRVAAAPSWPASRATVTVRDDQEADGVRRVHLRLSWTDPPMVAEVWPDGGLTRLVAPTEHGLEEDPDKAPLPPPGPWRLIRAGLDWPVDLVVEGPAGEPVELAVSAIYPGLPSADQLGARRPEGFMAMPAYRWFYTISDVRVVRERLSL